MSNIYIAHWSPVLMRPVEVLQVIEPILATAGYDYTGQIRRLEQGDDGLYYQIETLGKSGSSAKNLLEQAFGRGWKGAALQLVAEGYLFSLSFYCESNETTLIFEETGPVFYEQDSDGEAYQSWLSFLMNISSSIKSPLCLFEKNPVKRILNPRAFVQTVKSEGLEFHENPIIALIDKSLLAFSEIRLLRLQDIGVFHSSAGYSICTWMAGAWKKG